MLAAESFLAKLISYCFVPSYSYFRSGHSVLASALLHRWPELSCSWDTYRLNVSNAYKCRVFPGTPSDSTRYNLCNLAASIGQRTTLDRFFCDGLSCLQEDLTQCAPFTSTNDLARALTEPLPGLVHLLVRFLLADVSLALVPTHDNFQ
jgi:hypothetical protein